MRWTPPTIRLLVDVASARVPSEMLRAAGKGASVGEGVGDAGAQELEDLVCAIKVCCVGTVS